MHAHSCRVYVRVSGMRIGYRRAGSGEPVLFLHGGFGFDRRSWARQLDALADEFDVVAWDAPGCGESDDPPARFSMADYGDCVAGLIREIGLDLAHIVGLSFGSAVALACYGRHPELARSLVLAGAYAGWAGSLPRDEVQRRVAHVTEYAARPIDDWVAAYLPSMFCNSASPEAVAEAHELLSDARQAACLTGLRAMADADLRAVLSRIDVPTLLLYGEHDSRSPVAVGQALHAAIGTSRLVVLPRAGHLTNVEAPDAFNREVRMFLHPTR
jgi:pimeloyl-ACP methyl ester carboxylesterase